jgi:hypothetical protein
MSVTPRNSLSRASTPNGSEVVSDDKSSATENSEATIDWRAGKADNTTGKKSRPELALSATQKIARPVEKEEQQNTALFADLSPFTIACGALSLTVMAGGLASIIVGGMGSLQINDPDPAQHTGIILGGGAATIMGGLAFFFACSRPSTQTESQTIATNISNLA